MNWWIVERKQEIINQLNELNEWIDKLMKGKKPQERINIK